MLLHHVFEFFPCGEAINGSTIFCSTQVTTNNDGFVCTHLQSLTCKFIERSTRNSKYVAEHLAFM